MRIFRKAAAVFLVGLMLVSCGSVHSSAGDQSKNVTIYRDAYGVPHIYGKTDGDAAFGMAYAQAEDNFAQLELNFILATGRSAELFGEETFISDWVVKAMEIPELSKRDYENAKPSTKALLDGYAAGLNHYLATHPNVQPRLLSTFEPWYPLALIRRMYFAGGFLGRLGFTTTERRAAFEQINQRPLKTAQIQIPKIDPLARHVYGSNSWAANGKKIQGTGSYLFINPHLPSFGMGQVYEAHVMSDEGWNFTGYSRFGFPFPYVGFGENLGWASTDNFGDQEDAWVEHFSNDSDRLKYQYGTGHRTAAEWHGEIRVKDGGIRKVTFRKTHHGPILAFRNGKFLSAKLAKFDQPGWLDQWHAMSRAQNLKEFTAAVSPLNMQFGNYMYADRAGNIFFVYNGAFPKKDTSFDWNNPVDGSDPATEWQGYHTLEEIPQVLNPSSYYMQNTNTTPFMTSMSASDPAEGSFPAYMVRESDNARSRNARRILKDRASFDFQTWEHESFDTTMPEWTISKPILMRAFEETKGSNPERALRLAPMVGVLNRWNGIASTSSIEATLYADWYERVRPAPAASGEQSAELLIAALDAVVTRLQNDWGDWRVPWGDINRAQRAPVDERGRPKFCDTCDSIATPGVPHWSGGSQITWSPRPTGLKKRYKRGGNSYTAIIDFPRDPAEKVIAKSVHVFGASADPKSPHHMDQAKLLAAKHYKNAWLYLDDVKRNAVRAYHPGEELDKR